MNYPKQKLCNHLLKKELFILQNSHLKICLFHCFCRQPPYVLLVGGDIKKLVQTFSGNKFPFLASIKLLVETDWLLSVLSNL